MNKFFVKFRNPVAVMAAIILLGGLLALSRIQTSLFPEVTFPKIKIIIDNGLQPVNKMMITVTKPVEIAIKKVPHITSVRSTTSRGTCEISAYLDWNADIDLAQEQIQARINEIRSDLPPGFTLTIEKMNPSVLPVMGYTLQSADKSAIEMNMIANYTVKPYLSQVSGVSEVRNVGGKTKEYWVELNAQKMSSLGLTPDQVSATLAQSNFILSNGYINSYKRLYLSVTNAGLNGKSDLSNIVISNNGKRIVLLRDIATVSVHERTEYTRVNANGKSALLIAVLKQPNANLIQVSTEIQTKVAELNKLLPKGVSMQPYYIQADFVRDSIQGATESLLIGLLLALIVAILFLRSVKASAVILVTIPVTAALSLFIIYVCGYTLNIMTLGAIGAAIGLIIDDAIVVVEQIHRTHEEHPGIATRHLLAQSIRYLLPAMVGSSLSTIVIFIPFVLMSGVAGAYFHILTNTMIITLVCSFFVTWLILPVLYLLFTWHKPTGTPEPPVIHKTYNWVTFFIRHWWMSVVFMFVLIISTVIILPKLETGFLPEMDEGTIIMDYFSPPGTTLDETDRMLREVERIIMNVPEVQGYSRRTGTELGFFITEPNRGDYLIQLKKDRKRTTDEVIDDIRQQVESTQPALHIDFGQVIIDMLGDLMTSVQPIEVKVYGPDQKQLRILAAQIGDIVERVPGTADVFNGITIAGPSLSIQPDYIKLAQYGVTPANLQSQVQIQLQGTMAGSLLEKEQQTTIRVLYPGSQTASVESVKQLPVFLPGGKLLALNELATVTLQEGDAEMVRENLESMFAVKARLNGRDLGSAMSAIQDSVGRQVHLPSGYHITYGGAYADQQQSFRELLLILIAACLLVFVVILFLFRQIRVAVLILVIAILGVSGSYLGLYFTHTPLNVGSYTGLIMIVGIIGENAIFTFLQFSESLKSSSADEAIAYAISTRLRPKLMTALGAIIALLPLALGIGTGAQMHQPLAIAVIGGFIVALPLLLIVLPSMLHLFFRGKMPGEESEH
ncbi:MAG: efflux RND transporter permease subunit [Bacteroidetes bacterium]|nr:efflux RND transporter permease subunit [Bacteroidota bacterium]